MFDAGLELPVGRFGSEVDNCDSFSFISFSFELRYTGEGENLSL